MNRFINNNLKKGFLLHCKHHHSFSYQRKTAKHSDLVKTTDIWMNLWSKTHIPFLPSMIYSISYSEQKSLWNLISNGDITMSELKSVMNGKVPSSLKRTIQTNSNVLWNDYFTDMIAQGWVLIYIDDILIFSKDPKDHHEEWTVQVLKQLREKGFIP